MAESPLIYATQRLAYALERLEGNLQQIDVQSGRETRQQEQLTFYERENETLRLERENLTSAVSQLQYQYNDLQKVASTIYGKLDDSIKRLTKIIEN